MEKNVLNDMEKFLKNIKNRTPKERRDFFKRVELLVDEKKDRSPEDLALILEALQHSSSLSLQKEVEK